MKQTMLYFIMLLFVSNVVLASNLFSEVADDWTENAWLSSTDNKLSMILPAVIVIIVIIFALIDLGAVGVASGAILGLTVLYWLGIVYINPVAIISYTVLSIILIWKLGS